MKKQLILFVCGLFLVIVLGCNRTNSLSNLYGKYNIIAEDNLGWKSITFKPNGVAIIEAVTEIGTFSQPYKFENGVVTMKVGLMDIAGEIDENGIFKFSLYGEHKFKKEQ